MRLGWDAVVWVVLVITLQMLEHALCLIAFQDLAVLEKDPLDFIRATDQKLMYRLEGVGIELGCF